MIRLITIMITTLFSLSITAQSINSIPRMAIIESDTVALLTIPQVKKINLSLIDLQMKTELIEELNTKLSLYQSSIASLESQNDMLCQSESELHKEITMYKELYEMTNAAKVRAQRSEKRFKILGFTVAIAGIAILLFK